MSIEVGEAGLIVGGRVIPDAEVLGFHERFDPWRGAVWLRVAGPGLELRVGEGYGLLREALRRRFPRLPFTADWSATGAFPGLVLGGPPAPWLVFVLAAGAALSGVAGALAGAGAGLAVAAGLFWPVARLHTALAIDALGVRAGPVWAPRVGWHEVHEVRAQAVGGRAVVRVVHEAGVAEVEVARALLPAVRARLRRLGALPLVEGGLDLDLRYRAMRPVAAGLPWGLLGASLAVAPWLDDPWKGVARGLLVAGAGGLVGAAVEARLDGWRTGGIFWMTLAWGLLLLAWGLGALP